MTVSDLFEPLTLLHGRSMRNRIMLAPLVTQQSDFDGSASEFDLDWYRQVSEGGYGLIQTGATTVEAGGIAYGRQLGIHDDRHLAGSRQIATSTSGKAAACRQCSSTTPVTAPIPTSEEYPPPPPPPAPPCQESRRSPRSRWSEYATVSSRRLFAPSEPGSTESLATGPGRRRQ